MASLRRPRSKYRAVPTHLDGMWFASKKEAQRYGLLKLLEQAGEIRALGCQPKFPISINGEHVFTYVADFEYVDKANARIVEDVKGVKTPLYRLKVKCVKAQYGVTVTEV